MRKVLAIAALLGVTLALLPSVPAAGSETQAVTQRQISPQPKKAKASEATLQRVSSQASELSISDLTTLRPEDLVSQVTSEGVTVRNVTFRGSTASAGAFSGGAGILGFDRGIILSSGKVQDARGPNESAWMTGYNGQPGDADLNRLVPGYRTLDATILEFDAIPSTEILAFQFVFGSEEYNEYVGSAYNDVFGFFVNGRNVAVVPGSQDAISINNVDLEKNSEYYRDNEQGSINIEMDGLTSVMSVQAYVKKDEVNHIKLAIADAGDTQLDSNVFIRSMKAVEPPKIEIVRLHNTGDSRYDTTYLPGLLNYLDVSVYTPQAAVLDTARVYVDAQLLTTRQAAYQFSIPWLPADEETDHEIRVDVTDKAGTTYSGSAVFRPVQRPTVRIVEPSDHSLVSGEVTVRVQAIDPMGSPRIDLALDGTLIGSLPPGSAEFLLDTNLFAQGEHTLTATAVNAAGLSATHSVVFLVSRLEVALDRSQATPLRRPAPESPVSITHTFFDDYTYTYRAISEDDPWTSRDITSQVSGSVHHGEFLDRAWNYRYYDAAYGEAFPVTEGSWRVEVTAWSMDGREVARGLSGRLDVKSFRTPVILLPGISGSWLYDMKEDGTKGDDRLWPATTYLDTLDLMMNEQGQSINRVYAGDPIFNIGPLKQDLGKNLVDRLTDDTFLYQRDVTLYPFGYDWRFPVWTTAESLQRKTELALRRAGAKKVNLIAHSMGGLVAKWYLTEMDGARNVDTFISIGTPYLGAPKAYVIMRYGGHMAIGTEGDDSVGKVADTFPAAHQLLPSRAYFDYNIFEAGWYCPDGRASSPCNFGYVDRQEGSDVDKNAIPNWLTYGATMVELDLFPYDHVTGEYSRWGFASKYGEALHDRIDLTEIDGIKRHVIVSYGSATVIGSSDADSFKKLFGKKHRLFWGDGDGTVPRVSAEHPGSGRIVYIYGYEHAFMTGSDPTIDYIAQVLDPVSPDHSPVVDGVSLTWEPRRSAYVDFSLECPVEVHIYDDLGNHTGPIGEGMVERNVPDIQYWIMEDSKQWLLPADRYYRVELRGLGDGAADLRIANLENFRETAVTLFNQVLISHQWTATMDVGPGRPYRLMTNNLGQPQQQEILPDSTVSGEDNLKPGLAPRAEAVVKGDMGQNGWLTSAVTVTLSAEDQGAGILAISYAKGAGRPYQRYEAPIVVQEEGETVIYAGATDRLGQDQASPTTVSLKIDRVAPVTSVRANPAQPDGREGWYIHPATVTLTAADAISGVQHTEVSFDAGATWSSYSGPVLLHDEGSTKLLYRSVDNAGNLEDAKQLELRIDQTAPTVTIEGGGNFTVDQTVRVTCRATDEASGVSGQPCAAPLVEGPAYSLGLGAHSVSVLVSDMAGNATVAQASFTVGVTYDSLCTLTGQFVSSKNLANSLCAKLRAAGESAARGNTTARNGQLQAYGLEVDAQTGKALTLGQAATLKAFALELQHD